MRKEKLPVEIEQEPEDDSKQTHTQTVSPKNNGDSPALVGYAVSSIYIVRLYLTYFMVCFFTLTHPFHYQGNQSYIQAFNTASTKDINVRNIYHFHLSTGTTTSVASDPEAVEDHF